MRLTHPRNNFPRNIKLALLGTHDTQTVSCIHVGGLVSKYSVEKLVTVLDVPLGISAQVRQVHIAEREQCAVILDVLKSVGCENMHDFQLQ